MKRALVASAIVLAVLGASVGVACGGGGEPKNLIAIYDTIPYYPGSAIDGPNDGAVAPAALVQGDIETFKNDRRMFVASSSDRQEDVLAYYAQVIPNLGWEEEDPPQPKAEEMQNYCSASFVTCLSFTKDDVRIIVSAPIQLQLNTLSTQGVSYHFHLEGT